MSQLITLPKKAEAVKPKLKRSELVEIMAHRIIERELKKRDASVAKLKARRDALEDELRKTDLSKVTSVIRFGHIWCSDNGQKNFSCINLEFDIIDAISADLKRRLLKLNSDEKEHDCEFLWLGHGRNDRWRWDTSAEERLKKAKEKARRLLGEATVQGGSRVPQLLADAGMQKVMDAFITKLENAESDQKAIAV